MRQPLVQGNHVEGKGVASKVNLLKSLRQGRGHHFSELAHLITQ